MKRYRVEKENVPYKKKNLISSVTYFLQCLSHDFAPTWKGSAHQQ